MGLQISRLSTILVLAPLLAQPAAAQSNTQILPTVDVWATRTGTGITGASNSVITAEDIARSPGTTIQDVLSREAGVQTWSTTGGNNGATTTVDLRGFGAFAVRESAARTGRNPQTGAPIQIEARRVPTFKAGKELRDKVNNRPA